MYGVENDTKDICVYLIIKEIDVTKEEISKNTNDINFTSDLESYLKV